MKYKTDKLMAKINEKFGTQKAFADAIGVDKTTLNKILKKGKEWKGSLMFKAAKALEIPIEEIEQYFLEPEGGK